MSAASLGRRWAAAGPQLQAVLRIVTALCFFQAGSIKLFGWPMAMPPGSSAAFPTQVWFAGVLEVVGGALLMLGLCTRPIAFVLAGEMAVTYFQFYYIPSGGWPMTNNGVAPVLFCFIWLFFSAAGAGAWSLDARRGRA